MSSVRESQVEQYNRLALALLKFSFPWALAAFYILSIFTFFGQRDTEFFALMAAYFLPPAGKESVIPLAIARGFDPVVTALYVLSMDFIVALFLAWNWDLVLKIPGLGHGIKWIMSKGTRLIEKRPWLRELEFTGIVVFMVIPFQGSGAIWATILGRLIGMRADKVVYAIVIGSAIGSFGLAFASAGVLAALRENVYLGIIMLLTGLVGAHFVYHKHFKRLGRKEEANPQEEERKR